MTTNCLHRDIFETGEPAKALHQHKSRDGKSRWVEIMASPMKDEEGRVTHMIESVRDVTELKLLQQELVQSQKMENLGNLAGGIAHDFNNILSAIMGITDIAIAHVSEGKSVLKELKYLSELNEKAAKLVHQILAFGRKQALVLEPQDLNQNVELLVKLLGQIMLKKVEFQAELEKNLWLAEVDSGQVDQILMNLCINSGDAMPDGGKIEIKTCNVELDDAFCLKHHELQPGRYVQITVSDNGSGMNEETQKMIFDPFFTTKEPGKGTGLGLSVVFGIIKQHMGMIKVSSEVDKGTIFEMYFPACD